MINETTKVIDSGEQYIWAILCASLLIMLALPAAVEAAQPLLPAGATPGGSIPKEWLRKVPSAEPDIFPIPPVIERQQDQHQGARVVVRSFAIQGITLGSEQGIHADEIQYIVGSVRKAMPPRLSVMELQKVADAITAYFRRAGYVLARAIIPAQEVNNGHVMIHVLEGNLGRVIVEGNQNYSSQQLIIPFTDFGGKPVHKDQMEGALLNLTDYPGLDLFGVFQPGTEVGTTDLTLKVQQEKTLLIDLGLDNYGTEYTGEYRTRLGLEWNNPSRSIDRFSANLYQTLDPDNSLYGDIAYQRPFYTPAYSYGLGLSNHSFEVGQDLAVFDIKGDTRMANAFVRKQFLRSRTMNMYGLIDLGRKNATISSNSIDREDDLTVLAVEAGFDSYVGRGTSSAVNQAVLRISHGFNNLLGAMDSEGDNRSSRVGGSGKVAGGQFDKLAFQYARRQYLTESQSLLLRTNAQYSRDLLVSIEQLGMGGPNNVRAYSVSEFLQDRLVFVSAEWIIDADVFDRRVSGETLQFSLFVDWSRGWLNDPLANEPESVKLSGAGVGVQLMLPRNLRTRLDISTAIGNQPAIAVDSAITAPANGHDPQILFSLNYDLDI